jgi:hypothetical protein
VSVSDTLRVLVADGDAVELSLMETEAVSETELLTLKEPDRLALSDVVVDAVVVNEAERDAVNDRESEADLDCDSLDVALNERLMLRLSVDVKVVEGEVLLDDENDADVL